MKNTKRSKGFYVALYSCLGVVLAGSLALTLFLNTPSSTSNYEYVPVDTFGAMPTLPAPMPAPIVRDDQQAGIREFFNIGEDPVPDPEPTTTPAPTETPSTAPTISPTPAPEPEPEPAAPTPAPQTQEPSQVVPVFNHFTDDSIMFWPVLGEVLMEYSSDALIFDPTLNSWRVHNKINIASEVGSSVRAAAEGIVVSVDYDSREGNRVTIDHGNGWTTTYSQLDNLTVSAGDVVAGGQIIAQVSDPSLFTSGLGENIGFRVRFEDDTVNPLYLLQQ